MAPAVVARAQARASVPLTRPRFARSQPVARGERSEARGTASPGCSASLAFALLRPHRKTDPAARLPGGGDNRTANVSYLTRGIAFAR